MSTISTGIGLVSGLPIQDLVDGLISVQSRPITLLQNRLSEVNARRTALLQISAQLLAAQNIVSKFKSPDFFGQASAASSNESALVATALTGAVPGQYSFTVRQLAASHQVISGGFATVDSTPIGAGVLTIERAAGTVNGSTPLDFLRGQEGIQRGRILITDRAGGTAQIDLVTASTINDVVQRINAQATANVNARVDGDHLVITDNTGLTTGSLTVVEVNGGRTALDLGILGASATGEITGANLVSINESTRLSMLNDSNGVRRLSSQDDFEIALSDGSVFTIDLSERLTEDTPLSLLNRGAGIGAGSLKLTNKAGQEAEVDLSAAVTLGDVKSAIEAAGASFSVVISGQKLIINDASEGDGQTVIEDVDDGTVAASLGIDKSSETGSINGDSIYFVETLGDVTRLINEDVGNGGKVLAAISGDGLGLTLTDQSGGGGVFSISALNGSGAAEDLGLLAAPAGNSIVTRRLVAGLDTVLLRSLNGGAGVTTGVLSLTDRSGATATIDLTGALTLADVISVINASGTGITASTSASGLGIELNDASGGAGNLVVTDVSGTIAADLGIDVDDAVNRVASGNLQKQYVSAATLLSDLNNGLGIARGRFRITDSNGQSAVVDLTQGNEKRLQDVIDEINSRGIGVAARINDTGDGLLIEDTAGGAATLKITDDGGTTARSLGILGQAADGESFIDGSFESRIEIDAGDTLDSLLTKIDQSRAPVDAAILNSGGGSRPFRLNLSSVQSGISGALAIDTGATGLSFDTLSEARDATVVFGPDDAGAPLIVTGATNSIGGVISGVRLDLVAASATPVTVTVERDVDAIVEEVGNYVSAINAVISSIDELSRFDPETESRGVLTGDATARRVRDRLVTLASRSIGDGTLGRLSEMGITVGSGAVLRFDEAAFREQFERDPEGVGAFFSTEETGFAAVVQAEIERFTDADSGAIALQSEALQSSEDLLNGRIEQLQLLLERRRQRLLDQFAATESVLAQLQSQQSALTSLSALQFQ